MRGLQSQNGSSHRSGRVMAVVLLWGRVACSWCLSRKRMPNADAPLFARLVNVSLRSLLRSTPGGVESVLGSWASLGTDTIRAIYTAATALRTPPRKRLPSVGTWGYPGPRGLRFIPLDTSKRSAIPAGIGPRFVEPDPAVRWSLLTIHPAERPRSMRCRAKIVAVGVGHWRGEGMVPSRQSHDNASRNWLSQVRWQCERATICAVAIVWSPLLTSRE